MTTHPSATPQRERAVETRVIQPSARTYTIFIVAGEHSGDALGAKLMAALDAKLVGRVRWLGVGGHLMERQGLVSQFPLSDIAVMGPLVILKRLPLLVKRVYQTVAGALAAEPDVVVVVDAPEFTHPIAKRIRAKRPSIPIIDYVSPTVWAWRPGRAKKMAPYIDHVLALLPFEPEAHARLGGPACTYVGHPLIERIPYFQSLDVAAFHARFGLDPARPVVVVLPGSRRSEVERLMGDFLATLHLVEQRRPGVQFVIPAMRHVRQLIEAKLAAGPKLASPLVVVDGQDEDVKFAAFRAARAALAASGTVTLELALTRTPMVVAYKVDAIMSSLRWLITVNTAVLANLITGDRAIVEHIQENCTPERLAASLDELLIDSPARAAQLAELDKVPSHMAVPNGSASDAAAAVVIDYLEHGRKRA